MAAGFRRTDSPLAVFRIADFRAYLGGRAASTVANALIIATVSWEVYARSGSILLLSLIGVVFFVASTGSSFISGAVADTYDRRLIMVVSQLLPLGSALGAAAAVWTDHMSLPLLFILVAVAAVTQSFDYPARQALLPTIVPNEMLARALTVSSTVQSLCASMGPVLAGALIAWQGAGAAFACWALLAGLAILSLSRMHNAQPTVRSGAGVSLSAIREGLAYVRHQPVLLGVMSMDLFAVVFGGAKALLPVFAMDVLHTDATGYGLLAGAMEVGALVTSLALISLPMPRRTGRVMIFSVIAYGLTTAMFGLSNSLPLSILLYGLVGMADQVSVVMRQTTIQLSTPDELRGRVTAVNSIFVTSGGQLNAIEAGLVATITSPVFAVVSGGLAVLAVVPIVASRAPDIWKFRVPQSHPSNSREAAAGTPEAAAT